MVPPYYDTLDLGFHIALENIGKVKNILLPPLPKLLYFYVLSPISTSVWPISNEVTTLDDGDANF